METIGRNTVKCAVDKCFQVADRNVDHGQPHRCLFRRGHLFFMILRLSDSVKRWQGICFYRLAIFQVLGKKLANSYFGNTVHRLHSNKTSAFLPVSTATRNRSFSRGSSTSLAGTFTADKGVVELNQVGKPVNAVSVSHRFPDLAQHVACCNPGNTDMLGDTESRNTTFVGSHQINRPKPFHKRNFGRNETRCQRSSTLGDDNENIGTIYAIQ